MKHLITGLLCATLVALATGCATSGEGSRVRTAQMEQEADDANKATGWTLGVVGESD